MSNDYIKDFDGWNKTKQNLDKSERLPTFKEREVWWCATGINIGSEIYGKGNTFTRPVLILRKFNNYSFLGVPLTSKRKTGSYFHPISFKNIQGSALLNQIKIFDCRRLKSRMGYFTSKQANDIREKLKKLI